MFFFLPENGTRPSLVVQASEEMTALEEEQLRAQMYGMSCPSGLLIDPRECVVLRDKYSTMEPDSIVVVGRLATERVLAAVPAGPHVQRVERWLRMLSSQWDLALPTDSETAGLILSDIVPAALGADLRIFASEAAE